MTTFTIEAPPFCGPLGDMGRDPVCKRSRMIYTAHAAVIDVNETAQAAERKRNPRKRAALQRWVETIGAERVAFYQARMAELPECTHPAEQRAELTYDQALPACTC